MTNELGEIVYKARVEQNLTQDQLGARYDVSGPAIFKFEKGYVKPSLKLWIKMAKDFGLPERRAVLLWSRAKLPKDYKKYIDLGDEKTTKASSKRKGGSETIDYSRFQTREEMQRCASKDKTLPKELVELLKDPEMWETFKVTGHEINMLRDLFGPLGNGRASTYREALRLIREFSHSF